ncbi:MAG: hypothetical protein KIS92_07385 [Planctomycetota bacterium]|nr:hypothetical protein [Planctomycetota bacterium]
MVSAVSSAQNANLTSSIQSFLNSYDFLKLFTAQLEYQNPMEPMSNSELMQQVGQMTNIQMISDMTSKLSATLDGNSMLQASGMIGHVIEFPMPDGTMGADLVTEAKMDGNGRVSLTTLSGLSVGLSTVRGIR